MKNNSWLIVSVVLWAGCQHAQPTPSRAPAIQPVASIPAPAGIRLPERVQTYTIGAYADPDDPTVRHAPHVIHRIEAAAQWSFGSTVAVEPVLIAVSAVLPAPTDQTATAVPPVSPPSPAAIPVSPPNLTPPAIAPVAIAPPLPPVALSALMPNADGLIDLAALAHTSDDDTNPFAVRVRPPDAVREISLRVRGVIGGAAPSALINDRAVLIGESVESLTLERAEADAALLRSGDRLLRLPVSATAVRIRLAR